MIAGGGGDEQARMRYGLRVLEEEWSAQVIDINNNFCLIRLYTVMSGGLYALDVLSLVKRRPVRYGGFASERKNACWVAVFWQRVVAASI